MGMKTYENRLRGKLKRRLISHCLYIVFMNLFIAIVFDFVA